jgi:hypothetical protein
MSSSTKRRLAHPETARERVRKSTYKKLGISEPTRPYPAACECCGVPVARRLHLDHDHETRRFRGWLCLRCNVLLGALGDTVQGIEQTVQRFKRFLERT